MRPQETTTTRVIPMHEQPAQAIDQIADLKHRLRTEEEARRKAEHDFARSESAYETVEQALRERTRERDELKRRLGEGPSRIQELERERDELKEANEIGFQTAHDERDKLVVEIIKLRTALERVKAGLCYPDEYRQVATEALATPQP